MTWTYFTARSNLVPYAFVWEKGKPIDFSETMLVFHVVYEYQRSRSFIDLGPNLSDSVYINFFTSITTRPFEGKFHVKPPWDGGTKACWNGLGHMIKVAAMPIYKIFFSGTESLMTLIFAVFSSTTTFVLMMALVWPWPILRQGQIWSPMILYEKR